MYFCANTLTVTRSNLVLEVYFHYLEEKLLF